MNHEHHHHEHEHGQHRQLWTIGITTLLLIAAVIIEKNTSLNTWQLLLVYLVPYLLIGSGTLKEAAEGIVHGEPFNEHLLMSVATIGALCIGFFPGTETEYPEAVFVMLFFQVGEFFEGYAEGKSRDSISHLMDIRPDIAHVVDSSQFTVHRSQVTGHRSQVTVHSSQFTVDRSQLTGESSDAQPNCELCTVNCELTHDVNPDEVEVGSFIEIRPGEKVPLDGTIVSGKSTMNTMALTGESAPLEVNEGDDILSGCINLSGVIMVRTTKTFGESTVSKIIKLVEDAGEHKSQSEAFITRFARIYTPIVVCAAIAIALIPPCLSFFIYHLSFSEALPTWLYRAMMFLVVSCPCALVISVPLTFFGGLGGASRKGILVKGANYLDVLSKINTVVFDKTGTLTHGRFSVVAVHPEMCSEYQLLHLAAHVEHSTSHPIGAALRDAFPEEATDGCHVTAVEEVAGKGIQATVGDKHVCVGNTKMMDMMGVRWHHCEQGDEGTVIHVAIDGTYAGHIVINDQVKADSAAAIEQLKELGVKKTVMLTGDREEVAARVAQQLQIDEYHAELLPTDKVKYIDDLRFTNVQLDSDGVCKIVNRKSVNCKSICFVGDGINDAPVLARADVGIAMGALGSDAAIEAADVVLMDDQLSKIATAIRIARRTIGIARQNIWFAIGVKVAVLVLATFGLATMWLAVFADVGVTVLAVLNAMRALKVS